jgi:hypothetical protein
MHANSIPFVIGQQFAYNLVESNSLSLFDERCLYMRTKITRRSLLNMGAAVGGLATVREKPRRMLPVE